MKDLITIEEIAEKFGMESNGYAMFNDKNFLDSPTLPCYIPENAQDITDIYSRADLERVVTNWLKEEETTDYLNEIYEGKIPNIDSDFINFFVVDMYETLEWQLPETFLNNKLN